MQNYTLGFDILLSIVLHWALASIVFISINEWLIGNSQRSESLQPLICLQSCITILFFFPIFYSIFPFKITKEIIVYSHLSNWFPYLYYSFITLFFIRFTFNFSSYILIRFDWFRKRNFNTIHSPAWLLNLVEEEKKRLDINKPIQVVVIDGIGSPAVINGFKAIIFMPAQIVSQWAISDIKPIIIHELVHVRNRDHFFLGMIDFIQTILWFFPGVYWLKRRFYQASEFVCDDAAASACEDKKEYAKILFRIYEIAQFDSNKNAVCAFANPNYSVHSRIQRLLSNTDHKAPLSFFSKAATTLPLVVLMFFLCSIHIEIVYSQNPDIPIELIQTETIEPAFQQYQTPTPEAVLTSFAQSNSQAVVAGSRAWIWEEEDVEEAGPFFSIASGWSFDPSVMEAQQTGEIQLPNEYVLTESSITPLKNIVEYRIQKSTDDLLIISGEYKNLRPLIDLPDVTDLKQYIGANLFDASSSNNPELVATLPLRTDYSGDIYWVLGVAVVNRELILVDVDVQDEFESYHRIFAYDVSDARAPKLKWVMDNPMTLLYDAMLDEHDNDILYLAGDDLLVCQLTETSCKPIKKLQFENTACFFFALLPFESGIAAIVQEKISDPFDLPYPPSELCFIPLYPNTVAKNVTFLPFIGDDQLSSHILLGTFRNGNRIIAVTTHEAFVMEVVDDVPREVGVFPTGNKSLVPFNVGGYYFIGREPTHVYDDHIFSPEQTIQNWMGY
ncbi:MAG: M56 family metallopeptidase [Candidatus Hinthialibacter antarcticus]|nr:M56 family metallopeptidase [Candidatus Hinthialibacter antarcticus]